MMGGGYIFVFRVFVLNFRKDVLSATGTYHHLANLFHVSRYRLLSNSDNLRYLLLRYLVVVFYENIHNLIYPLFLQPRSPLVISFFCKPKLLHVSWQLQPLDFLMVTQTRDTLQM